MALINPQKFICHQAKKKKKEKEKEKNVDELKDFISHKIAALQEAIFFFFCCCFFFYFSS